jgi:predicted nicotinamide N-methyase
MVDVEPSSEEGDYAALSGVPTNVDRTMTADDDIVTSLLTAARSDPSLASYMHWALLKGASVTSPFLRMQMHDPGCFESLYMRFTQKDVAKGCIDPDLVGVVRDELQVSLHVGAKRIEFSVPAFMAHLATPMSLVDPESDDAVMSPLWSDGTWTGTLIWDSAVYAADMLLSDAWANRLRGKSLLELGCGLGLPGLVGHAIGASPVLLTDRRTVVELVREGLLANSLPENEIRALELAWSDEAASAFKAEHLEGKAPDCIIACDCIFAPIFGSAFLLLQMLMAFASPSTIILVILERRDDDGAELFFEQTIAAGFSIVCIQRHRRVVACELRLNDGLPAAS